MDLVLTVNARKKDLQPQTIALVTFKRDNKAQHTPNCYRTEGRLWRSETGTQEGLLRSEWIQINVGIKGGLGKTLHPRLP